MGEGREGEIRGTECLGGGGFGGKAGGFDDENWDWFCEAGWRYN